MKKIITSLLLLAGIAAYCQEGEFKVYPNGLIYSEGTMSKLSHIVDSLNLQFKVCDLNKEFYSKQQTVGHFIRLDTGDIKAAKRDMEQQLPMDQFLAKYPYASVERKVLIIKNKYRNYEKEEIVDFQQFDLDSDYGFNIQSEDLTLYDKDLQQKWLFSYSDKTEYSKEYIRAFYFPDQFKSVVLPRKYASMIGYSDCLVDTTSTKFKDNPQDGWAGLPLNWESLSAKKKRKLLDKMRSTRVVGGCSMDNGPRIHAINIALLSAETANWEVFLKAHLDIMNDRFDRASDGSYAWGERNTYIKELEELNINVQDLILGISFRVENAARNHYYGSIGRVGRALSETRNKKEIEAALLATIADQSLDDYNRVLFYFLFVNYNHYTKDETVKLENKERLAIARKTAAGLYQQSVS